MTEHALTPAAAARRVSPHIDGAIFIIAGIGLAMQTEKG
jgi:hypothetical protein